MPVNKIIVSKNNLSLTYNVFDESLSGDNQFNITIFSDTEPGNGEILGDNYFIFSPNYIDGFQTVDILSGIDIPTIVGTYNFTYQISSGDISRPITILLNVVNTDTAPPDVDYHLKYWLEYANIGNDKIRLEINQKGYLDESIEIHGRVILDYQEKKDLFQPIIASSLNIELEADEELSLQDLYSEDELMYQAVLKRNDQIIFIGFIKPDGIFEDFVSNRWMLEIDAYDGLSTLKNLSFVSSNGINYVGKLSILEVVKNCIERTSLILPINVSIEIFYEGFSGTSIFEETFVNTERYYQDAQNIMDCESVLKSILQIFNATIIQMNGEWWIYRSIDLRDNSLFVRYIDGIYDGFTYAQPSLNIGSQINHFGIFHCNSNQKKSIAASVQAYRIYYKYGNASNILSNGNLNFEGAGLNIPGWIINQVGNEVKRLNDKGGLWSETVNNGDDVALLTLNQNLDIGANNVMVFRSQFGNFRFNTGGLYFSIGVGDQWFNLKEGKWQSGQEINVVNNSKTRYETGGFIDRIFYDGQGSATYELTITSPIDGLLKIIIWRDQTYPSADFGHLDGQFELYSLELVPDNTSNIKGVYYTAKRNTRVSTVTKENITVYNGDSNSTLYVGTLYKSDQTTATEKWYRKDISESLELLSINAEDNLRISPRPMLIFEGDIFGYIPLLSILSIDNVDGKFQPTKYSYDTFKNQIKLSSKEFESVFLDPSLFTVSDPPEIDYGNETKVTIV